MPPEAGFDPLALPPPAHARRAVAPRRPAPRAPRACASWPSDPHPLARLIAAAALAREESRGAHQRLDFPATDPALDLRHVVVDADGTVQTERWD